MGSFVVIGLGRFGSAVALTLMDAHCEVLAIDIEEKPVQQIAELVTNAAVADARDEAVLRSLGIDNYDCAIVSIGSDVASSIIITLTLKELGVQQVVCKAGSENHKKALQKVGADWALIPEREMAVRVGQSLASPKVFDYIKLSEGYTIVERSIPSRWSGKKLRDLDIWEKYAVSVIAIHRGKDMLMRPNSDECMQENDQLVLMGKEKNLTRIERLK